MCRKIVATPLAIVVSGIPVLYLWGCYLNFTCKVATYTLPVRLLSALHLWDCYLYFTSEFSCEVFTCALPVKLLPVLYLWGCYRYLSFTCEVVTCTLPQMLLPAFYLRCCYLFFTCEITTCALPVRSSVWMEGLFSKMCRHLSAISRPIISFRFGDDSTKQWLQAWLQYSPMLAWRISTFFFFKVSSVLVSV